MQDSSHTGGKTVGGLGEVFIVGVCLLTLVRVPGAMSAPSTRHAKPGDHMHPPHKPTESGLSYLNPCGKSHEEEDIGNGYNDYFKATTTGKTDLNVIKHIITQTKNALAYAESFRDKYVLKTFHARFETHHTRWENQTYDWLPDETNDIPKRLGKNVSALHLVSKTFDEFLININEYLQKFAVGLEQIVADQKKMQGEFQGNFRKVEGDLRSVLCEIRQAMMERNITPREPVSRTVMSGELRNMEPGSFRNIRDWFIFRDLMNGLEYVIQVLNYFEKVLPLSGESS